MARLFEPGRFCLERSSARKSWLLRLGSALILTEQRADFSSASEMIGDEAVDEGDELLAAFGQDEGSGSGVPIELEVGGER